VIEQLDDAPFPPDKVHVAALEKLPLPPGLTLQLTVPVGVTWLDPLSVTVTVHVVVLPTVSVVDVQLMLVVVGRNTESA